MLKYIAKKLMLMVIMIVVISFVIFVALNNTGVDPVTFTMGLDNYSSEQVDVLREELGLNDPLLVRYVRWWGDILSGDFGYSIAQGYPIKDGLVSKWPISLEITVPALLISTVVGIGIGILSAYWQNSLLDYLGRGFAVLGNSMPSYFFELILIQLFAVHLGWLPTGGRVTAGAEGFFGRLPNLILPIAALSIPMCGNLMRYTRNTMLDVANQDYVKLARSKGIPEWKVYLKHVFRNSMRPIVTVLLFRLTMLIGGSVAIETIFSWPGVGVVLTSAITSSDYPVVMLYVLIMAVMMLIISFLVDLFTALLDPRVRLEV